MLRFISLCLILAAAPAAAQDISQRIGAEGLAATEAALSAQAARSPEETFALGGVRFLRSVERALQLRWRTGMNADRSELPVLRLPIPENPAPEPFAPELVPALFSDMRADMESVREVLAGLGDDDFGLEIALADLWFDINMNGRRDEGESVIEVSGLTLTGAGMRPWGLPPMETVTVRFDRADAEWLIAYSHFLSGFSSLVLAFDPAPAIARVLEAGAAMEELRGDTPPPNALDYIFGRQVDRLAMVYFALQQQPDPAETRAARDHFLAMIAHNRLFWALVELETDNDREWVPNDRQQSALGLDLPPGTGEHWLAVLADAEALLTGEKLMPHWRFGAEGGINLSRMFDDPAPVDLPAWAHGSGLLPWAEKGERVSNESWRDFQFLVRGDAMLFALFLN